LDGTKVSFDFYEIFFFLKYIDIMTDYYNNSDYQSAAQTQQPMNLPSRPSMAPSSTSNMGNDLRSFFYDYNPFESDWRDLLKRAVKYLFEGIAVAFVAYAFTRGKLNLREILMLGITAAFVFAILDTFSPTISLGARFGAGFGIGQSVFGVGGVPLAATILA
jgi:hypothetical protein